MNRTFIDIHSHVLHNVDDGCVDIEQSVFILQKMASLGVTDLFLTPHYCKRRDYVASVDRVKQHFDELCKRAIEEKIDIKLHLGTEMEYSNDCARYIKEGRVNTLSKSRYILVEFPPYVKADTVVRAVMEIRSIGFVPIIAHVERYKSIMRAPEFLHRLKDSGAYIQVNIRSVCDFNFSVRRFLKYALKNGLIDFLAGDVHSFPIEESEMSKCEKFILRYAGEEYLKALLSENAKNTILNQDGRI